MEKEKKCPECTHRIKKRTEEETKLMINRLNRIEGQVRGIRRMVENNAYCMEIIEKKFSQQNKVLGNIEKFAENQGLQTFFFKEKVS